MEKTETTQEELHMDWAAHIAAPVLRKLRDIPHAVMHETIAALILGELASRLSRSPGAHTDRVISAVESLDDAITILLEDK